MKIVNFEEPFIWFNKWFNEAKSHPAIKEPTAISLATVGAENKPSLRMVLLKKFDEEGFCFFTNLTSRKGKELAINNHVALCFYWSELGYQVRVEGVAEKVSPKEADNYFSSRARDSQIGAWASKQSQKIETEQAFQERIEQVTKDFNDTIIPRPPFWSGFRVQPNIIEFWEEKKYRLHKRTLYKKSSQNWIVENLYP